MAFWKLNCGLESVVYVIAVEMKLILRRVRAVEEEVGAMRQLVLKTKLAIELEVP